MNDNNIEKLLLDICDNIGLDPNNISNFKFSNTKEQIKNEATVIKTMPVVKKEEKKKSSISADGNRTIHNKNNNNIQKNKNTEKNTTGSGTLKKKGVSNNTNKNEQKKKSTGTGNGTVIGENTNNKRQNNNQQKKPGIGSGGIHDKTNKSKYPNNNKEKNTKTKRRKGGVRVSENDPSKMNTVENIQKQLRKKNKNVSDFIKDRNRSFVKQKNSSSLKANTKEDVYKFGRQLSNLNNPTKYTVSKPQEEWMVKCTNNIIQSESGNTKDYGSKYDYKVIVKCILYYDYYKLKNEEFIKQDIDKIKNVSIFFDKSSSLRNFIGGMMTSCKNLSLMGYNITLYDCSNGFLKSEPSFIYNGTDDNYWTYGFYAKMLKNIEYVHLDPLKNIHPNIEDAAKIINKSEFSIIWSDFDGFDTFAKVSKIVNFDRIPYLMIFDQKFGKPNFCHWLNSEDKKYGPNDSANGKIIYYYN